MRESQTEVERLKMSVKTPASCTAHALSTWDNKWTHNLEDIHPSEEDRVTSATEIESALASSAAAAGALSVWAVL